MEGWIKVHRQFIDWEWYNKSEAVHLFIHLLLSANHKDNHWQGTLIKRGEYITSIGKISVLTGISQQTVRTLLKKLETTEEIVVKSTNKYTHITICKYDNYQDTDEETNNQSTNNQQTTNKQLTTNKNDNNDKNDKKVYTTTHFFNDLLSLGIDEQLANDVIEHRKKSKGIFTQRAFNGLKGELDKFALGEKKAVADALTFLVEQTSWRTFTYEFYKNRVNQFTNSKSKSNGTQKSDQIGYTPLKQFTGLVD